MDTYLTSKIGELEAKSPRDFSTEDLRIAIGQNINLTVLIPLAMSRLKQNILAEGDYYPGDLLQSVLSSDEGYWRIHRDTWNELRELYKESEFERDNSYRQLRKSIGRFELI